MARSIDLDAAADTSRRRRVRRLTLRLALCALAVYAIAIIAFVNRGA